MRRLNGFLRSGRRRFADGARAPRGGRPFDAGACVRCGGPIEPGLATLGSISCHDCRQGSAVLRS